MLFTDNQLTNERTEKIDDPLSARFTCDFHRGNVKQVSKSIRDITGYQAEYFTEGGINAFMDIITVEEQLSLLRLYLELCEVYTRRTHIPKRSQLMNIRHRDGHWIKVEIRILKLEFLTDGALNGISGMVQLCYDPNVHQPQNTCNHYSPWKDQNGGYNFNQPACQEPISKREKEVLYLIAHGYSSKMVADKLSISVHTAINHRTNLMDKFQAKNTAELILMASRRFWL